MPIEEAREIADELERPLRRTSGAPGKVMAEVYDETCEAKLIEPTFVMDHPREVSPLARAHRDDPDADRALRAGRRRPRARQRLLRAERPVEQRARFEDEARLQGRRRRGGRVGRRGLHPRARVRPAADRRPRRSGIDRLVMLLAGAASIREVILFPTMRPQAGTAPRTTRAGLSSGGVPTAAAMALPGASRARAAGGGASGRDPAEPAGDASTVRPGGCSAGQLSWAGSLPARARSRASATASGSAATVGDESVRVVGHVASVLVGLALLLLAFQIARGKQRAWMLAVALFARHGGRALRSRARTRS